MAETPAPALPSDRPPEHPADARRSRGRGLVGEIVASISASLRDGTLQPGDRLPTESVLVERFEVSRTVVREALSHLQAAGLVRTRHGIGTFVAEPPSTDRFRIGQEDLATVADVISVLELRISLETEAAGLAARRRDPARLAAMQAALDAFERSIQDDADALAADFQFHLEVARATGNRHFADLMTHLGTRIIPRARVATAHRAPEGRIGYLRRVQAEHRRILAAIRDGNVRAARAAMRTHLTNSRDRLAMAAAPATGDAARTGADTILQRPVTTRMA